MKKWKIYLTDIFHTVQFFCLLFRCIKAKKPANIRCSSHYTICQQAINHLCPFLSIQLFYFLNGKFRSLSNLLAGQFSDQKQTLSCFKRSFSCRFISHLFYSFAHNCHSSFLSGRIFFSIPFLNSCKLHSAFLMHADIVLLHLLLTQ